MTNVAAPVPVSMVQARDTPTLKAKNMTMWPTTNHQNRFLTFPAYKFKLEQHNSRAEDMITEFYLFLKPKLNKDVQAILDTMYNESKTILIRPIAFPAPLVTRRAAGQRISPIAIELAQMRTEVERFELGIKSE